MHDTKLALVVIKYTVARNDFRWEWNLSFASRANVFLSHKMVFFTC